MHLHDPYTEFTKFTLKNGLEVHSQHWNRSWIIVNIIVHTGAREDPLHLRGLAHYVEHMVSENIPGLDSEKAIEFFNDHGGSYNFGSTNFRSTKYSFRIPADADVLKKSLEIFGSMLLEAELKEKIEREREVIHREYQSTYTIPQKLEWEMQIRKSIFDGHWLSKYNSALGTPDGFLKITQTDLQNFYNEWYTPKNMSLVVVGGIETTALQNILENSIFGISKPGNRNGNRKPLTLLPTPVGELTQIINISDYINADVNQTDYAATWSFPANLPDKTCGIFTTILRKILNDEIREKRSWAYSLSANYINYEDVYEYSIFVSVPPKATYDINEVVRKCIELAPSRRDMFDKEIKSENLNWHMSDLSGGQLANICAEDLAQYQKIITIREVIDALKKVSFDDMQKVAEILSPERQFTCLHIGK